MTVIFCLEVAAYKTFSCVGMQVPSKFFTTHTRFIFYQTKVPSLIYKKKIKSSLYSLNTLSGVTSERCPSPQLCAKAHTSRLQR